MKEDLSKAKFTVLGSRGFIGSHLVKHLEAQGAECFAPSRDDYELYRAPLGHVMYCIGLTANFRERPFDTVRAHVIALLDILENCNFDSFLYLSSTRVYMKSNKTDESSDLRVNPNDPEDLYNLSKLMGESICFSSGKPNVRIARLSNVVGEKKGSSDFLSSIISDALEKGNVTLNSSAKSEKDYVSVEDAVNVLQQISVLGKYQLYNVASGENLSHGVIAKHIQKMTGCQLQMLRAGENTIFPTISINRVRSEFNFSPRSIFSALDEMTARILESQREGTRC